MADAGSFSNLWPKTQKRCPDIKFQFTPFKNTPENARAIFNHCESSGGILVVAESMRPVHHPDHILENISIFDFEWTDEEMAKLKAGGQADPSFGGFGSNEEAGSAGDRCGLDT